MNHKTRKQAKNAGKTFFRAAATFLLLVGLASCKAQALDRSELVLGTICTVRILDGASNNAMNAAFARLSEIEAEMSANISGTVVAEINKNAGIKPVPCSAELRYLVKKAMEIYDASDGAFDPSIGALVKLWGIGFDNEHVPEDKDIKNALLLKGKENIIVDDKNGNIFLAKKGMELDLGAIAKGYAADQLADILGKYRVKAAIIDLGGNIKFVGKKPDKQSWKIGIQNPYDSRGARLGMAILEGGFSVVTSGIYERNFTAEDGSFYHHIFDPATGYPVRNGLVSVSIISKSSTDADGLATALFVLGKEKGIALADKLGVGAIFIDEDKKLFMNDFAKSCFLLEDRSFTEVNSQLVN